MRCRRAHGGQSQAGIALLLVVWILALFTVIAGEFMASGRVKAAAEHNKRDDLRGLALALAGYQAAVAALDAKIDGFKLDEEGSTLLLLYPGLVDGVPAAEKDVPLGDGTYSWRIIDEDGLVNINTAKRPELEILLKNCGMEPGAERDTVIDSIIDWIDPGTNHQLNGAEDDYYRGLNPPYSCKDAPIDVAEELLLVKGVTPRLFAGGDVGGQKKPGLFDLVSPYARYPPNRCTAPTPVLEAINQPRPDSCAKSTFNEKHFSIVATGKPAGGGPSRSLRAVVLRQDTGGDLSFPLVYWNDTYIPE